MKFEGVTYRAELTPTLKLRKRWFLAPLEQAFEVKILFESEGVWTEVVGARELIWCRVTLGLPKEAVPYLRQFGMAL